jgi:hypothetical protein
MIYFYFISCSFKKNKNKSEGIDSPLKIISLFVIKKVTHSWKKIIDDGVVLIYIKKIKM